MRGRPGLNPTDAWNRVVTTVQTELEVKHDILRGYSQGDLLRLVRIDTYALVYSKAYILKTQILYLSEVSKAPSRASIWANFAERQAEESLDSNASNIFAYCLQEFGH